MYRFRGEFDYTIDAKGRVNIPAKFRKSLLPEADDTFVISRGPDGCLRAYPQDAWQRFEDHLATMPQTPQTNRFKRALASSLADSCLDNQGRISLTRKQLTLAGITKNITLVGQLNYIELWDTERYQRYLGDTEDFDDVFYASIEGGVRDAVEQ